MNIIVCIKRVVATDSKIKVGPDAKSNRGRACLPVYKPRRSFV